MKIAVLSTKGWGYDADPVTTVLGDLLPALGDRAGTYVVTDYFDGTAGRTARQFWAGYGGGVITIHPDGDDQVLSALLAEKPDDFLLFAGEGDTKEAKALEKAVKKAGIPLRIITQ